jgi:hypothetical protein
LQELLPGIRGAPQRAELGLILEELRQLAEQHLHELLRAHRRPVRMPEGRHHHVLDGPLLAIGEPDLRSLPVFDATLPSLGRLADPHFRREVRAAGARVAIDSSFDAKQRAFLDFVLQHYVSVGVEELDQEKLTPLLRLKYQNSLADAVADLGAPEQIGQMFAGFQKFLYEPRATA